MSEIARDLDSELLSISRTYVGLPPEKRSVFRARLAARGIARASLPIVPFPGEPVRFPLSHAQERLWFLWKFEPQGASYNITGAVRLDGQLDAGAVRKSIDWASARHPSLRKRFEEQDGVAYQVVGDASHGWATHDLSSEPAGQPREAALRALLRTLSLQPFDLMAGPLLRVALIRCDDSSHVLHFSMHHIVSDAWSLDILTQEFATAYAAFCRGAEPELAPLGIQYGDYALWQREWLDEQAVESQLAYWRDRLGTEHPVLELPMARKRTGLRGTEGGRVSMQLSAALSSALRALSQRHGATLFMTLLAAYDVLLARYSNQQDIRVGVPTAGRDRLETEGLIGFFVNTLVIRSELAGVRDFGGLLAQVNERVLEAQAHQDLPFARLVDALQPARSLSTSPLFQAMFNFAGAERGEAKLPGLTIRGAAGEMETSRFDLVLNVADGEAIGVALGFARDVFDEPVVARMLGHYVEILEQIVTEEAKPLGAIVLNVEGAWQAEPIETAFEPIVRRIAEQAVRQPLAPAVHCEGERLNYGELVGWSNRIARRLAALGVQPDERIGLCLTRSAGVIASLLGVLKSGAAFVPLDPEYPADRLAYMMEDAGVQRVIADRATAANLADVLAGKDVIDLADVSGESDAPFDTDVHPDQLAYVIYTSGSTGRPKGVAISHRSLSLHLNDFIGTYDITSDDKQLQSSTINFDVALHEMLPALMQGGQVEMRGPQLWDLETTSRHLAEENVTFSRIPTAYWQQWLREPPSREALSALRQITVGGEGLPGDSLRQWREGPLSAIQLDNLYGPTETTVACMYRRTEASDVDQAIVSIGVPYPSRNAYVMDASGNEVPVGALGELCIGGNTLARGYLGRAGQTAEKFIPNPFRNDGSRLYRSGDLCRRREDGTIDFLGRIDQQVKLRGFRIELGEIEAALRQVPGVKQSAVELKGTGDGKRLVGYVSGGVDSTALRSGLEGKLPGYMVPSAFVVLARLPVMPNGKIDRNALPEPDDVAIDHYTAPVGELEVTLARVWAEILGVEQVGRHDNFFERGGDSIQSLKAIAALQRVGIEISPRQMFENPDVAALAAVVAAQADHIGDAEPAPALLPLPAGERANLPLSHAQQRLWFLWNLQPDSNAYHMPGAIRLRGTLDRNALRASFDWLAGRHESLRTTFVAAGDGRATQRIHDTLAHDFRSIDVAAEADRDAAVAAWAARLAAEPFDLTGGPLLRVGLARIAPGEHVLVVVMHHIVSDGWSVGVLLREFVDGYRAFAAGAVPDVQALPIQYADYAVWQRRWLEAGEQDRQLAYWRDLLGGEQPVLALPADHPRQALGAYRAASERIELPAELGRALVRVARQRNATPFMVLLAAFDVLLHRYTGETDVRVGVPVANRNRPETAGLIGFFVNTQVLKADLDGRTTLAALLDQVRTRALDAQAHQDLPFDVLVDALQPERSLSHTPLFQVAFNHQRNDYQAANELEGLGVERYGVGGGAAQFELTVNTQELPDGTLSASLRYADELFDARTMQRFGRHYVRVLEALTGDLSRSVDEIALLDTDERDALLAWGRNDVAYPDALPVHERIAARAQATPDAIAVVYGDQSLRYGELDARANRLAHRLAKHGVGPEVRVGIAVERSIEMIVGLLAILKAGGAYVPLDPDYPQDRLSYMIEDSGIALVLTQSGVRNTLPIPSSLDVLELDGLDLTSEPETAPAVKVAQGNLAYVIYTSGSTGRPKGAQLAHHNVARLLDATEHWFHFDENDVWTMFHSYAFDFSVWEIFGALCYGGKLVVVPFVVSRSPEEFAALLRRERVTVLNQTPSAFRQLMAVPGIYDGEPLALREVIFGGEALEPQTLAPWIARFGDAQPRLVNMYGITETTVHVTYRPIGANDLNEGVSPVGVRIPDLGIYVLDAERNLVPVGVTGELYVGGAGVARGYLNRASLTAERFVPDPFGANGERLYRTGDLARWTADGALEYLGRIDHQVKIRGFRIELGEIDAQLLAQAGVRESITLAQEGPSGARLVSYVTAKGDAALDGQALRTALGATLPDYMVPTAILPLEALPLTANGKVDRKALPQPEFESAAVYAAPEGEAEAALASIWRDVLGIERVGRHDNFFELGGDSILSLQIVARAREAGWKITPRHVFEHQSLAALAASLAHGDSAYVAPPAIEPVPAEHRGALPLSHAQQRLWFLWNLQPDSSAYHIDGGLMLRGEIDMAALRGSFDALVARHESLRTRFVEAADGQAVQVVDDAATARCDCRIVDLVDRADRDAALSAWTASLSYAPFDLGKGPLLRVGVARLAADEHLLVVAMHHIVSDGWSIGVLLREFVDGYRALSAGQPFVQAALPIQYADYAVWQRRWLDDGEQARQLAYWRGVLGDAQPVLALPADRPRQALGNYRAANQRIDLPPALGRALHRVARERNATPFMVLLAAFQILLHRYTGEREICVGVPVANRNQPETAGLIGFFVNTQVLKAELDGRTTLAALLDQVRTRALDAQAHQDLPFDVLVDALQPERSLSHTPLFQVVFNHQRSDFRMLDQLPGLIIEGRDLDEGAAQFELTLNTWEAPDGTLSASVRYARELFDTETMARFSRHYVGVLEALTGDLQTHVNAVALLEDAERHALLALSRVDRAYAEQRPVHEIIRAQVEATPDAVAVEFGSEALTYRELDARANRLAHRLMSLGVGAETRVGIAVERSVEMVVGLLAILKAGGAYVPLDPEYPQDRLAYMIEDSGVALLLTQSHVRASLPVPAGLSALDLDTLDLSSESDKDPGVAVDVENAAYVIYTSGSTGRPKGAVNRHVALTNRIVWMQEAYQLDATDTVLQKTPFSFDVSVWEFFWPLMVGAKLAVAKPGDHRDPARLVELIQAYGVTTLHFVPPMLQAFVAHDDAARCTNLKRIVCSGEALPAELANRALALLPNVGVFNLYGPTEAAIDVTHWTCVAGADNVPIGRPIANIQTYVLDDALNLAPRGVAGELYLGGIGLARGYLNRPGLTAERFVADPFGTNGERLYRTGDLARWNADGALEYLGRIDHQVKIRGFRIELGEIESQLTAQAEVREAVVTAQTGAGGARLIGYVTAAEGETIDVPALRAKLGETLPDYMVPSVLMVLEALPLNPNGKVDRKLLPKPEAESAVAYAAPEGEAEQALAAIWCEVLGIERVGRHDNFFELGGHSLLVMQVASRLKQRLGMAVPIVTLFVQPTIASLAPALSEHAAAGADLVPIARRAHEHARIPLSHAQDRLWFLWKLDSHSAAYNTVGATRFEGALNIAAVRAAIDHVVARHDILRTRFEEHGGVAWQVVGSVDYAWQTRDLAMSAEAGHDEAMLAMLRELSAQPFDLQSGPLLRVTLIRCADRLHVLHFAMHHIVSDAWSLTILQREFAEAYAAACRGASLASGSLPIQYGDYALWQREQLHERAIDAQLEYWRLRLGTEHPILELPTARKRTGLRGSEGGRVSLRLPVALSSALHRVSQRHGATLFMTLLAAYDVLLARYSNQQDIRVGVPTAGRDRLETEALIGFFVNTVVIRTELAGVDNFGTLLAQVKARVMEAQAHQDLPFARLVEALQPARSLSHTPLFQTMFNYLEAGGEGVQLPGLTVSSVNNGSETARFDLVLNVADGEAIGVSLGFARDVFDEPVVARMLGHYVEILEQIVTEEAKPLGAIVLDVEGAWQAEPIETAFAPIVRRISAQAAANPLAPAVHCEGERLNYGELVGWSNRIARRLAALGVQPDERIGLCLTRSAGVIASLLGVLKSGAAFVPLDPEYPADRLAYMMEDAGVQRVIADRATAANLADVLAGKDVIDLADVSGESDAPFDTDVHPDQLAYVIYTSGSTGRPKGVAISHRSLSLHLNDFIGTYDITSDDKQLQSSTINFDVALHEMLPALMQGGQVEMRGPQLWDLETTSRHLAEENVTFSRIPTAYWQQWLREPPSREALAALRQITVGGEGLPGDSLRQWREGPLSAIQLDNLYGPTETTVACMYRRTEASDVDQAIVSIGVPYPSRNAYVMDASGNEVPVGALGELCIGGNTLARGYLGRAGQTAEKFIPNPFRNDGSRLYRSGDLCRRREDGTIDFLGRIDQQVKLRGFRIELGEIEAALRQVPGVNQSAVELKGTGDGKRLVGYVSGEVDSTALRSGLEGKLPGYMVPSAFVVLERLPVMPNGKVDRHALPEPDGLAQADRVAPRNDDEAALLALWQAVLGRDDFGVTDNFFEVGGDSLAALRITHRAAAAGLGGLTLESLFTQPTVASLAAWLDANALPPSIVPLNATSAARKLFVLHPVFGLVGEYRELAAALDGEVAVYGLQSRHYTDAAWWPASFDAVIDDYVADIRRVQPEGPYRLLGWSSGAVLGVELAHRLESLGETVACLLTVDSGPPARIATDAAEVSPAMARRRALPEELEPLREFIAQTDKWKGLLPEGEQEALLEQVALVSKYFESLQQVRVARELAVPVRQWWAERTETSVDAMRDGWQAYVPGERAGDHAIDADHVGILHDAGFIAQVRELLTDHDASEA